MKKSSIVRLSLLIVAAAALTVIFLLLKKQKDNPTNGEQVTYFTVTTIDVNSVDRISLKSTLYEGEFKKQGETWVNDEDILNQKIILQIPDQLLSNLRAIAKVDNPASDAEYGLENPSAILEAYAGDKRLVRIELGDKVPTKDCYYCRFNDEKPVYTVAENYARLLLKDRTYYVETVTLPSIPDIKNVREITITGELFQEFHAIRQDDNPYDYSGAQLFPWSITKPYRSPWDADVINGPWMDRLEWYLSIYAEQIFKVKPDEFSKYGLDQPKATLTVRYADDTGKEENSYTLQIGNKDEETGNYYVRLQGVDAVLVMTEFRIKSMCEFSVFSCTYHSVFFPSTKAVKKVTAQSGDLTMTFTHETSPEGEDLYYINGVAIDGTEALAWAQKVMAMKTSAYVPTDAPDEDPILVIMVEPFDPSKNEPMTIRIYDDPSGYDIVERLGACDCTIDSRLVDDFINYMKKAPGAK
ncbi:MAG: DUF4340 domain-containing protein [Lachnospiraceae bacterium]|nr:DUF4340 domain-containing protein [Lachnospiraceae bacterium]